MMKSIKKFNYCGAHGSSSKNKYLHLELGVNSRLDAIQATVLRIKLRYLDNYNTCRIEIAKRYNNGLSKIDDIVLPEIGNDFSCVFHQYTIRVSNRDELKDYLKESMVPTMIYYPMPLHLQPAFKYLNYKKEDFFEAKNAAKEILSLPIYPELAEKDQDYIIRKIKEFYGKEK